MSHRTPRSLPADGWTPSSSLAAVFILTAFLAAGCSGGSAGGFPSTATPPPTPVEVFELNPQFGGAGDVLTLRATSIDSNPANLRIEFSDFGLTSILDGLITDVRADGTQPGLGTIWAVDVVVPGGVRTGSVTLYSGGIAFGGFAFEAAPEIIGAIVSLDGTLGTVTETTLGATSPEEIYLYGNNLVPTITDVTIDEGNGAQSATAITFGPPFGAGFNIPTGMQVIQVSLPSFGALSCDTVPLRIRAESQLTMTAIQRTAEIEVPLSRINPGDLLVEAEAPGFFTGVSVPPGIRSGDIAIDYSFFMVPATSRYDITAQYQDPLDPSGNTWLNCTPTQETRTDGILPGSRVQNAGGLFVGPGSRQSFVWDSAADLSGDPVATRIRLRATNPTPNAANCLAGEWISPKIVINNGAPPQGTLIETFDLTNFLDPAGGSAIWGSGLLSPPASGGSAVPAWGVGFDDVVLLAGRTYEFDTDSSRLFDVTDPSNPLELATRLCGLDTRVELAVEALFALGATPE